VIFNLLFVLFPLAVLVLYEDVFNLSSVSLLTSAFIGTLFFFFFIFLLFLYTRFASDNLTAGENETERPLSNGGKADNYAVFVQHLTRRELEVIEAVLAGSKRYKEIAGRLGISVSTVKSHLKHIYRVTGISNVTELSFMFRGYNQSIPPNSP
jgi:DNA-binding CsgD family transcriptional regulator